MRQNPESRFEYLIKESRAGRLYIIPLPAEDQRATNNNAIPQTQSIKPGQSSVHVMNVNSSELEGFHGLGQWPLLASQSSPVITRRNSTNSSAWWRREEGGCALSVSVLMFSIKYWQYQGPRLVMFISLPLLSYTAALFLKNYVKVLLSCCSLFKHNFHQLADVCWASNHHSNTMEHYWRPFLVSSRNNTIVVDI